MDVYSTNWNEADDSNSTAAPDGWPEGMAPSGVNNSGRAMMGATKRYVNQQIPLVTGGTSTAYTLTYAVAPGQLADGQTHLVQFNAVNGAAPTLNVNALGAKPLHFWASGGWGAWPANMVAVDQIVRVTYNAAAGTYRAIGTPMVLNQSVSGVTTIDFAGIPANVTNLEVLFDLTVGTNGASLGMQYYNSGGSVDSGGTSYATGNFALQSSTLTGGGASASGIALTGGASSSTSFGISGGATIQNIQGVKNTQCMFNANYLDSGGSNTIGIWGSGRRVTNGPITGIRLFTSAGTISGTVTVRAK